jgi:type IV pilus assembly protein PilX
MIGNPLVLRRERGAALMVALVMLLLMTILGVTAMRTTTLQERMAGNLRDSNLAFQAAEVALRQGETFVEQPVLPAFTGTGGLLQVQAGAGQPAFWSTFDWPGNSRAAPAVAYTAAAPRYVLEELPAVPRDGGSERFASLPDVGFYRITASAVGGTTEAVTVLQTTYRR